MPVVAFAAALIACAMRRWCDDEVGSIKLACFGDLYIPVKAYVAALISGATCRVLCCRDGLQVVSCCSQHLCRTITLEWECLEIIVCTDVVSFSCQCANVLPF